MSTVWYTSDPEPFREKEEAYIETRRKEGRLLSDAEVALLPKVGRRHPHAKEWQLRKKNLTAFLGYWRDRGGPLRILDLGCGNGWMSHQLSTLAHSQVTGMDVNQTELDQAARIFGGATNLRFVYGDIFQSLEMTYDCIVLAAAAQYFEDIAQLVNRLKDLLDPMGEIHILETMFYETQDVEAAAERSRHYYQSVGQESMARYYFHHSLQQLASLGADILYEPNPSPNPWQRLTLRSPFHWVRIQKNPA